MKDKTVYKTVLRPVRTTKFSNKKHLIREMPKPISLKNVMMSLQKTLKNYL